MSAPMLDLRARPSWRSAKDRLMTGLMIAAPLAVMYCFGRMFSPCGLAAVAREGSAICCPRKLATGKLAG